MALTQHLMRRGRSLRPAAADVISLTIGRYHDARTTQRPQNRQKCLPHGS
jgi:hypothetical protein